MTFTCQSPQGPHLRASEPTDCRHELLDRRCTQTGQHTEDCVFDHGHLRVLNMSTECPESLRRRPEFLGDVSFAKKSKLVEVHLEIVCHLLAKLSDGFGDNCKRQDVSVVNVLSLRGTVLVVCIVRLSFQQNNGVAEDDAFDLSLPRSPSQQLCLGVFRRLVANEPHRWSYQSSDAGRSHGSLSRTCSGPIKTLHRPSGLPSNGKTNVHQSRKEVDENNK